MVPRVISPCGNLRPPLQLKTQQRQLAQMRVIPVTEPPRGEMFGENAVALQTVMERSGSPKDVKIGNHNAHTQKGKGPEHSSSCQPISFISVLGNVIERMLKTRFSFLLESRGLLKEYQAGFRQRRATEEQLIRLSQIISDGIQSKPMHRMACPLVDYSRDYSSVWKDALFWRMLKKGVPFKYIRWIQAWLANRRIWVSFGNGKSERKTFQQGATGIRNFTPSFSDFHRQHRGSD